MPAAFTACPSSSTSAPCSLASRRLITDLKPMLAISLIASGFVAPPQAMVVSACAKVEMPGMSFFVTCCANATDDSSTTSNVVFIGIAALMRQSIQQNVDADRVRIRRKMREVLVFLAFALPPVGDVVVVDHHDHDAAFAVHDGARALRAGLNATFRRAAAGAPPRLDR